MMSTVIEPEIDPTRPWNYAEIHKELYVLHCVAYACHLRLMKQLGLVLIQDDNMNKALITSLFEKSSKIIGQSLRFTKECKEQLYILI
jgi:hypothetical protein